MYIYFIYLFVKLLIINNKNILFKKIFNNYYKNLIITNNYISYKK